MELHIVLIGPRCVGKTNTGIYLAGALGAEFIDADPLIESKAGKTIKEIVEENNWEYFRKLETELVRDITSNGASRRIIFAPGGGAVAHEYDPLRKENVGHLKSFGSIILLMPSESLEESARIIYERMTADGKSGEQRPSLTDLPPEEEVLETLRKRSPFYMQAKDYVIYTKGLDEKGVAEKIINEVGYHSTRFNLL